MKQLILLLLIINSLYSCRQKPAEKIIAIDTSLIMINLDTLGPKTDSHYFWSSELDQHLGLVMKRTIPISNDSLTLKNLIGMLNDEYPEIQLDFLKIAGDSIFLRIPKSNYLTNQMGSSGANAYLAEVTYNLTELSDINYVDIKFREGDHASPGVYKRTDFIYPKSPKDYHPLF